MSPPPLPPGFTLDQPSAPAAAPAGRPPLPPGFKEDTIDPSTGMREAFGSGVLMNFGDEAKAALQAAAGPTLKSVMDWAAKLDKKLGLEGVGGGAEDFKGSAIGKSSDAPTYQQRYDADLAAQRAKEAQFKAESPVLATTSNVLGNMAGASGVMAALPAAVTSTGPSLIGNMLAQGALGAGLSGVAAYGAGEGGTGNRAAGAIIPTLLGGATGAALPLLGAGANVLLETGPGQAIADPIRRIASRLLNGPPQPGVPTPPTPPTGGGPSLLQPPAPTIAPTQEEASIVRRLATALQRSGGNPTAAGERVAELGPQAFVADVGPEFQSVARSARSQPGPARTIIEKALDTRREMEPGILRRAFEGDVSPPPRALLDRAFDKNITATGRQSYQGEMVDAGLNQSEKLAQMAKENPFVANAIKEVEALDKAARQGRPDVPALTPVEVMHRVKQMIEARGFRDGTAIPGPNMQTYRDLATDYTRTLKTDNPALDAADRAYTVAKSLPEYHQQGHNFLAGTTTEKGMESSAPAVRLALEEATSPQQPAALRAGATNYVQEATTGRNAVGVSRGIARDLPAGQGEQQGIAPTVEAIYGPEHAADIQRAGDILRTFQKTEQGIRGGSNTTDKILEVMDDAANISGRLNVGKGPVTGRILESIEGFANRVLGPNENIRAAIARAMVNPNQVENQRILALAAELMGKRAQPNLVTPATAGAVQETRGYR